jgi:hypothetical protein
MADAGGAADYLGVESVGEAISCSGNQGSGIVIGAAILKFDVELCLIWRQIYVDIGREHFREVFH